MKTSLKSNWKSLALGSALLLSLLTVGVLINKNQQLKKEKNTEIIRYDSIISVKLLVDRNLDKTQVDLKNMTGKNAELDRLIKATNEEMLAKKAQIDRLLADNASVGTLRKQIAEYKKLISTNDEKIAAMAKENGMLAADKNKVQQQYNEVQTSYEELNRLLEIARELKTDNINVKTFKVAKNKKAIPTVRAKKTNRFSIAFDLFENPVANAGEKMLYAVIKDAEGKVLNSPANVFVNNKTGKESTYSAKKIVNYNKSTNTVTIEYDSEYSLKKGTYSVEIYTDGNYSGRREFGLR